MRDERNCFGNDGSEAKTSPDLQRSIQTWLHETMRTMFDLVSRLGQATVCGQMSEQVCRFDEIRCAGQECHEKEGGTRGKVTEKRKRKEEKRENELAKHVEKDNKEAEEAGIVEREKERTRRKMDNEPGKSSVVSPAVARKERARWLMENAIRSTGIFRASGERWADIEESGERTRSSIRKRR